MSQYPLIHYPTMTPVFTISFDDMDISDTELSDSLERQIEVIHIDAVAEAYRAAQGRSSAIENMEWQAPNCH